MQSQPLCKIYLNKSLKRKKRDYSITGQIVEATKDAIIVKSIKGFIHSINKSTIFHMRRIK